MPYGNMQYAVSQPCIYCVCTAGQNGGPLGFETQNRDSSELSSLYSLWLTFIAIAYVPNSFRKSFCHFHHVTAIYYIVTVIKFISNGWGSS